MTQASMIQAVQPIQAPQDTSSSLIQFPTSDVNMRNANVKKGKQLSFLPEPLYNPKYPAPNTIASKALNMFLTGNHISHPQFETATGSWRLAAHVHTLKRLGWPVMTESMGMPGTDEDMRARSFVVYYLPDDLLEFMRGVQKGIVHYTDQNT